MVLSVLFLFFVVGCGGSQPQSSSEPKIEDPNAYLANLFHGIYKLEERDGASATKSNAAAYLQKVKETYPNVPVTVISPFGSLPQDYHNSIEQATTATGCNFINGTTLISQYVSSWNKDPVHPSSAGFNEITASLTPILQQKLG